MSHSSSLALVGVQSLAASHSAASSDGPVARLSAQPQRHLLDVTQRLNHTNTVSIHQHRLEVCMGVGNPTGIPFPWESQGMGIAIRLMMGMGMGMGIKPVGMGIAYTSRVHHTNTVSIHQHRLTSAQRHSRSSDSAASFCLMDTAVR